MENDYKKVECCGSSEIPNDLESYAQKVEDHYDVGEERGYLCVHRGEVKDAVIAGASWQKEKDDKELSEKIASAYQLGRKDEKEQMMKEANKALESCDKNTASYKDAFFAGVDWKEREMMKEAVEAKIYGYDDGSFELIASWLDMPNNSIYKDGDKVKIIIVKEEGK